MHLFVWQKFQNRYVPRTLIFLVLSSVLILLPTTQAASPNSAWVNSSISPVVTLGDVQPDGYLSDDFSHLSQAMITDCIDNEYQGEFGQSINGCWVDANGLKIENGGWKVKLDEEPHAALLRQDFNVSFHVSQNKDFIIQTKQLPDDKEQVSVWRTENFTFIKHYDENNTYVEYELASDPDYVMSDEHGETYAIDTGSLYTWTRYSENKKWLAIWNHNGTFVLINLDDFTSRTVRIIDEEPIDQYASMGVSNDGRYVSTIVYDEDIRPRVYDMETCATTPTIHVGDAVHCGSVDLNMAFNTAGIYGEGGIPYLPAYFQFQNNETLSFYSAIPDDTSGYWEHIIRAPSISKRTNYTALGDSFSSGEGAGDYYKATDTPKSNDCHLSKRSYPFLLQHGLELESGKSVACSGAKIKNIKGPERIDRSLTNESRTNQYRPAEDHELQPVPGFFLQNETYSDTTDIVTMSIGGNDIGFGNIISKCVKPGTCYTSESERRSLVRLVDAQLDRLVATYEDARKSIKGGRVYAIGYPRLTQPYGSCGQNVRMNATELEFADNLTNYLNDIVRIASSRAGVVYVDTSEAFYGHRLCEPNPAVHGVNASWRWLPFSPESYHPTERGQLLLAQAVNRTTQSLTTPMPHPNANVAIPENLAVVRGLLTVEEETPSIEGIVDFAYPPYQNYASAGGNYSGSMSSDTYGLQPNTRYELWMASTPTFIGNVMSDANGVVNYNITVPTDVDPGQHTLYLKGIAINGEPITIEQQMYVIASEDDWDGDGIRNEDSPCGISLPNEHGGRDLYWCGNPRLPKPVVSMSVPGSTFHPRSNPANENDFTFQEQEKEMIPGVNSPKENTQNDKNGDEARSDKYILVSAIIISALLVLYAYGQSKKHR